MAMRSGSAVLAGLCLLVATPTQAEWVEWLFEPSLRHSDIDNLNLSAFSEDEESDRVSELSIALGRIYHLTDRHRLRLVMELSAQRFDEFDSLDSDNAALSLLGRHKFGLGAEVPVLSWQLQHRELGVDDDLREGAQRQFALQYSQRWTARWEWLLGWRLTERDGGTGAVRNVGFATDVFDQSHQQMEFGANVLLGNDWLLALRYMRRRGDTDSSCPDSGVGAILLEEEVEAITFDDSFGGCVYRFDADSEIWDAQLTLALSRHWSLHLGAHLLEGEGEVLDYRQRGVRFGLDYGF